MSGTAAGVAALALEIPRAAAVPTGRRVAVFGGGVAGLTAAHELIERGYDVTVYEPVALGGRARSIPVPGTGADGRADLPGEHGFRFFPGCYQHVPDTMARIPFPGNADGVAGNLVPVSVTTLGFPDRPPLTVPIATAGAGAIGPDAIRRSLTTLLAFLPGLPPQELAYFADRMVMWYTMCDARRFGQWEYISWPDAIGAQGKSEIYQNYLARAPLQLIAAARPELTSARAWMTASEVLLLAVSGLAPAYRGGLDRILAGPTSEQWIDPWVGYLRSRGVRFVSDAALTRLVLEGARITSADVGGHQVDAEWFVCAMPANRLAQVLGDDILTVDPHLAGVRELVMESMIGVQFYLRRPSALPHGHIAAMGTPWAITAIAQAPMWRGDFASRYGDGSVADCLSVDVSVWDVPGILYGKPARACSKEEFAQEVWAQLERWLDNGTEWRCGEDVHSWFVDPGAHFDPAGVTNDTPQFVNTVGAWYRKPQARCGIENLFFCGEHVRTTFDLASMEAANEAGRRAANAVLDAASDDAPRAQVFALFEPPQFDPLKRIDADRYRAGLPHLLDR
ncbi:FAD-dependent oxidoreductase [Nocardia sp. NPDC051570]|uniref:hydroxysqualene dehydroxylase n=1 Tax=Nocardia sp. NPDC051570 TaxID=3364324 RepID=UPI0037953E74